MPAAGSNGLVFMSLFLSGSGGERLGLVVVLDYIREGVGALIFTCEFQGEKVWRNLKNLFRCLPRMNQPTGRKAGGLRLVAIMIPFVIRGCCHSWGCSCILAFNKPGQIQPPL